jgi:hypothetical protein
MAERKRAGARRSLTAAASTKGRRNDDTPVEHPQHPDQITLPGTPVPVAVAEPVAAPPQPREVPAVRPARGGSKYTAVLDDDTRDAFEHLARVARRRLGRHVDRIEVLSALVLLAADDASLRDQVVTMIGKQAPRR